MHFQRFGVLVLGAFAMLSFQSVVGVSAMSTSLGVVATTTSRLAEVSMSSVLGVDNAENPVLVSRAIMTLDSISNSTFSASVMFPPTVSISIVPFDPSQGIASFYATFSPIPTTYTTMSTPSSAPSTPISPLPVTSDASLNHERDALIAGVMSGMLVGCLGVVAVWVMILN